MKAVEAAPTSVIFTTKTLLSRRMEAACAEEQVVEFMCPIAGEHIELYGEEARGALR